MAIIGECNGFETGHSIQHTTGHRLQNTGGNGSLLVFHNRVVHCHFHTRKDVFCIEVRVAD